jgi:hypothetical protein
MKFPTKNFLVFNVLAMLAVYSLLKSCPGSFIYQNLTILKYNQNILMLPQLPEPLEVVFCHSELIPGGYEIEFVFFK